MKTGGRSLATAKFYLNITATWRLSPSCDGAAPHGPLEKGTGTMR